MPGSAATIGSMHVCPMCSGTVPHIGGPIAGPGIPTVLIGNKPAAVIGDLCICVGPPDTIAMGCSNVLIGGMPASTVGDMTAHGGAITAGEPTVLLGTSMAVPSAVMPIAEIPFPKINAFAKMQAALSGNSLKEAQANQEELKKKSEEQHGYLYEFNVSF
ncbi:PAAR domain-containing protein [Aquimarina sp. RZ0]|uniref:PAAR domain-containing protein n=1 Tax=Aquimarina sp. RZ0 TaxID=2607730 RepID=UPI0011F1012F|nr:PAAR domain-containing protein [Aquimarina sp. RZ0]KAA1244031.1 paar repeat-containing protein [Aquimarina sp. RZ0]